jgi:2-polyprenyl-6-methoxyphenol hydroxylase-like FAD-dependent oxidoreductase
MMMSISSRGRVLVSGASIAGPTLAYWLHRHGFTVTVVEKAGGVRGGGYPIDVRGSALGVVERMGLLPAVREAHVDSRRLTFLGADGTAVALVGAEALTGGREGRDVELPRGELTGLLYGAVRDDVEIVFGDVVTALDEDDDGVDVAFASGMCRRFDLVVAPTGCTRAPARSRSDRRRGSTATSATASPAGPCPTSSACRTRAPSGACPGAAR